MESAWLLNFFLHRDLLTSKLIPLLSIFDVFSLFISSKDVWLRYKNIFDMKKEDSASKHVFDMRLRASLEMFFAREEVNILLVHLRLGTFRLTGGFLLAVMNGENVNDCCDVDFVCVLQSVSLRYPQSFYKYLEEEILEGLRRDLNQRLPKTDANNYELGIHSKLFRVSTCELRSNPNKKIQIITLIENDGTNADYFFRHFDFKFCSNSYSKGKLVFYHPMNVKERQCIIYLYKQYGGIFYNDQVTPETLEAEVLVKKWDRICKYRKRGYHITLRERFVEDSLPHNELWNRFWSNKF
ncbi:MAG: hypothetical protein K2Q45_06675 [Nitrosomonas sp.]|nr:hypothetical protein [Nitrosomonas sp.]